MDSVRTKYIVDELTERLLQREENYSIMTQDERDADLIEMYELIFRNLEFIEKNFPKAFHKTVWANLDRARKLGRLLDEKYDYIYSNWC